jgi:hypothetical protein
MSGIVGDSITAREHPLDVDSRVDNMRVQDYLAALARRHTADGDREREALNRVIEFLQEVMR